MRRLKKIHFWLGTILFVPLLLIVTSGLVLTLRSKIEWLSPSRPLNVTTNEYIAWLSPLELLQKNSLNEKELKSIQYNFKDGIVTIRTKDDRDFFYAATSGNFLKGGKKNSLSFYKMHTELFMGENGTYLLVIPVALGLLILLLSGFWLSTQYWKKYAK